MNKKLTIILSFLVGVLITITIVSFTPIFKNNNIKRTKIVEKTSLNTSIDKIYKATVLVEVYRNDVLKNTGTGFIYKKDDKYGYILTNEHVLSEEYVKITLYDDRETDAEVLGKDEFLDLAVLRIDKKYVDLVATIGDSRKSLLGDAVFLVGSPLGYDFRGSVSSGIISGKDRMVKVNTSGEIDYVMRVIQVDASINPGNSGGPLLNINGEVIGVCSLKLVDADIEGMGFAIPIEYAINHVDDLEKKEEIKYPTLGIKMAEVNDSASLFSNDIDVNIDIDYGVVVLSVDENSKSNLKKGDIITKVNGIKIKNKAYLRYELYQYKSKDKVLITYIRNGHEKTTRVELN